jgi:hypothetical protein
MSGFNHSHMFDIIESKKWVCNDGRTASIYGSCPWVSDADRDQWKVQIVGYTVQHKKTGTVGIGRKPWETLEDAQKWLYGR